MDARWERVMETGNVQAHVAAVHGYALTVIGGNEDWGWSVRGPRCSAQGMEQTLITAMQMADDVARRMAERT